MRETRTGSAARREFQVGPPLPGSIEDAFQRAGSSLFALDLRQLPPTGEVAEWFRRPQPMRSVGAVFTDEESILEEVVLPRDFELVLFIEETTRAQPNPPLPNRAR